MLAILALALAVAVPVVVAVAGGSSGKRTPTPEGYVPPPPPDAPVWAHAGVMPDVPPGISVARGSWHRDARTVGNTWGAALTTPKLADVFTRIQVQIFARVTRRDNGAVACVQRTLSGPVHVLADINGETGTDSGWQPIAGCGAADIAAVRGLESNALGEMLGVRVRVVGGRRVVVELMNLWCHGCMWDLAIRYVANEAPRPA
jgi:hypothetical protein